MSPGSLRNKFDVDEIFNHQLNKNTIQKITNTQIITNTQNSMSTPSAQSCPRQEHLKRLLVNDYADLRNIPDELVFFAPSGGIYRMTEDESGKPAWLILTNRNGACGWYRTDSPYVYDWVLKKGAIENPCPTPGKSFEELGDPAWKKAIQMRDGRELQLYPVFASAYHISNLSFTTGWQAPGNSPEYETITIFIHDNDQVLGKCCPLSWRFSFGEAGPIWENLYGGDAHDGSDDEWVLFEGSYELKDLPVYNPTSYDFISGYSEDDMDVDQEQVDTEVDQEQVDMDTDVPVEEMRMDPVFNLSGPGAFPYKTEKDRLLFYTKDEFYTYYGYWLGDRMWEMASPGKMSRVLMLEYILAKNREFLDTHNRNYIIDKMVSEFM